MDRKEIKPVLCGLTPEELRDVLKPLPAFRSRQILLWITRGVSSFSEMTDLPLPLREEFESRFSLYSGRVSRHLKDPDGTVKLRITFPDGVSIESVLLSDGEGRKTACLSTQGGCPAGCVFCKTGSRGFFRNLESSEITEQFLRLRFLAPDISHIVIMGMGEPLLNLGKLRKALHILMAPEGLGISKRRVTLSTCGIVQGIRDLADQGPPIRLAFSLTAADEALRERLMPISKTNPLPQVKKALLYYQEKQGRRITLEAVLLGGINTRRQDAEALADFARGLDAAVNLIPWNAAKIPEFEGRPLKEPGIREIAEFSAALEKRGLKVTQRLRKGRSIAGACGQLAGE
ncbi:MAG: 23S rRNA (adenine(2503)-C(2))-methyltransferase RlmN [Treponema sp.]|jgi:23S rRNA (adenine2503-C2)-methyltransferase|nr:23S rRNA (adenine(2503)-C(2))-methyltransferase RlmN [Treponema sp.]